MEIGESVGCVLVEAHTRLGNMPRRIDCPSARHFIASIITQSGETICSYVNYDEDRAWAMEEEVNSAQNI